MDAILGILGKVGFDWHMALFNLINFLIVFWIIKRYAFQPVLKVIHERQEKAEEAVDNFQKAKTDIQMAEKRAQDIIDTAKAEASRALETAYQEAKELTGHMRERAVKEIEVLILQAKKAIAKERETMYESLQQEMAGLIVAAVEKVVEEKLDEKKDTKLITFAMTTASRK